MTPRSFLQDKVVAITGAGLGIGRELALGFAREGAKVVVNDIGTSLGGEGTDRSRAQGVVDEIEAAGGVAVANTESVADWDAAHRIVEQAVDEFGRIDCVVNNAGILRDRMFFNMSREEWQAVIDVHLGGTFNVSRAAAPHFKRQKSGAYVHMVSTSGLIGNIGQANYSAAKLGIAALSRSIALDMARFGVRSNCIAPFAWSRMVSTITARTDEERAQLEPLMRLDAGRIAPLAMWLASDAAEGTSGQIFCMRANELFLMSQSRPIRSMHADGGWTVESLTERAMPALKPSFLPLEGSADVFNWDPA